MSYDKERILILIKTKKKMENKVKVWIARDKDGSIFMHNNKPKKYSIDSIWMSDYFVKLNKEEFPSVKWEDDEPTEAYITLAEPQPEKEQPTPKQEIDWEQRRYEIAKEMMPVLYRQKVAVSMQGQGIMLKDIADIAVVYADRLIEKLKEKSE